MFLARNHPVKETTLMDSLLQVLTSFGRILQGHLFPVLEQELGALSDRQQKLVRTLTLLQLDSFVAVRHGRGRPPHDRAAIARALVAKAVFNFPTTRALLDRLRDDMVLRRLCGWEKVSEIPDESAFSRAFAEFAVSRLAERVHTALIERTQGWRLIGHISRDSTAIHGCEKPKPKPKPPAVPRSGPPPRYRKGSKKNKPPEQMTRLERQYSGTMKVEEMIAELPQACDVGCKTNSQSHKEYWIGYKLHLDVADGQIPISCVLTSASLHDSQVAIPLAETTARRVTSLYDLMDGGYESLLIRQHSEKLGHVPLIDVQARGGRIPPMAPHQAVRFRERTTVERVNARLKEEFGGESVRVRGWAKVMTHLMFGILALSVDQILRLTPSP
jgi:IS5 family transposase